MKTVWKFAIVESDLVELQVPEDAQLIHVDNQGPLQGCLWFLVDDAKPRVTRRYTVRGTGHDCSNVGPHVGSYQLRAGTYVFHVFEH